MEEVTRWNVATNVPNGMFLSTDKFVVTFSNTVASIVECLDPALHGNGIYSFGSGDIYGNVIHDVFTGYQTLYVEAARTGSANTNRIYNNLIYNPGSA